MIELDEKELDELYEVYSKKDNEYLNNQEQFDKDDVKFVHGVHCKICDAKTKEEYLNDLIGKKPQLYEALNAVNILLEENENLKTQLKTQLAINTTKTPYWNFCEAMVNDHLEENDNANVQALAGTNDAKNIVQNLFDNDELYDSIVFYTNQEIDSYCADMEITNAKDKDNSKTKGGR